MELIESKKKVFLDISMVAEYKIRALCSMLPNREWSGVLFYEVEGGFEDLDAMKLHVRDFITLDIGSGAFTEFEITPDVCAYMVENNLLDCQTGLIHSHNIMATFFSDVDSDTLLKKGSQQTHFLSLIVNNAGEYSAAITAQVKYSARVLQAYMMTYGNKEIEGSLSESEERAVTYFKAHITHPECLERIKDEVKTLFKEKATQENPPIHLPTPTLDYNGGEDNGTEEEELDMDYFTYNEILKTMFSAEIPKSHVKEYSPATAFEDFCDLCRKVPLDRFKNMLNLLYVNTTFSSSDEYREALETIESVQAMLGESMDTRVPVKCEYYPYYHELVSFMEDMAEDNEKEKLFETYLKTGRI